MAPNTWMQAIMPCLRPRSSQKGDSFPSAEKELQSFDSSQDIDRSDSVVEDSPHAYESGLEPVTIPQKSRPQTILASELPCPTPVQPSFDSARKTLSSVGRSKSEALHTKRNNKSLKGKRKRSQTFNISGPTDVRRGKTLSISGPSDVRKGPSDDPKLSFPLTYPSPSRQRPGNLTMDRRDPSAEHERPRTAPSGDASQKQAVIFPLRADSFQIRSHAWRLAPLPPMPALDIETQKHNRNGSGSNLKRKPVPLRIRGNSSPSTPATGTKTTDATPSSSYPIGFAIEMPGSLPPTAKKSPIELSTLAPSPNPAAQSEHLTPGSDAVVEKGLDTPLAGLETEAQEAATHTAILSSIPNSPSSPIYSHRLSEGARDLLNFFPTTPKLSRANSIRTLARSSSTPPLSPRLIEYADVKYRSPVLGSATNAKARLVEIKAVEITSQNSPQAMVSPANISPRMVVSPGHIKQSSPPLHPPGNAWMFAEKELPPTPKSAGFSRGRFISLAAGLEVDEIPGFAGLGITTDADVVDRRRQSSGESVPLFMV